MSNQSKIILLSLVSFLVAGCSISRAVNKTLSPPTDTKWVNIEVKKPSQYTKPFPLEVRYISYECMKKRISGFDGSSVTEPSYNGMKIPLQQQGKSDVWIAKVAMSGGGPCDWTLSEINLGIEYTDATHLGKGLIPGSAVGATVAFDNDASRNGQFDTVAGNDFNYTPKYYPFIKKWNDSPQSTMRDKLYLFGKEDAFWKVKLDYKPNENILINYNPSIDESKKVLMIFPNKKGKDAMYSFVYPDGSVISSKNTTPDFSKVNGSGGK
ncbi:Uncharacterised protein [Enterobacter kobei]|uniref:hypothetical protein n=1 Tax=Enterobacter kobei TaxID=208224 RepID=UPI0012598E7C|nr:hypothetical protein [Enterobacter kobei]VAL65388.1 Uncharacterised protein [Enterobacter kobei]